MTQVSNPQQSPPFSDRPEGGALPCNSQKPTPRRAIAHQRSPRAFTLIELMISIALVVLLILGVSQVFQYTTQAVGAGEAVTAAIRNSRSVQSTFDADFAAMVGTGTGNNDAASLIISSRAVYAFRDAKDQNSQGTLYTPETGNAFGLPSAAFRDLNSDNTFGDPNVNGEVILPNNYNYRNHRIDTLSFFARNFFSRQTGNLGTIIDPLTSPEAWIWYGHLWLPDNAANYPFITYPATGGAYPPSIFGPSTFPGAGTSSTNPNNYFANQWVLGRQAMVLKEKSTDDENGLINDNNGITQRFIDRINAYPNSSLVPPTYANELEPLTSCSQSPTNSKPAALLMDNSSWFLEDGRYDLAATTIAAFRSKLTSYLDPGNPYQSQIATQPYWYDWMMDGNIYPPAGRIFPPTNSYTRVKCNPYLSKPFSADHLAQATPYFLGGCSQFIVEFAGDFLTQDSDPTHTIRVGGDYTANPPTGHPQYGDVLGSAIGATVTTNVKPDGQLDFFINAQGVRQTIWYGLPRNTSGQPTTCAGNGTAPAYSNYLNPHGDVVPLRDWLQNVCDPKTCAMVLPPLTEINAPFEANQKLPPYLLPAYQATDYNANMTLAEAQRGYTCAWGPSDVHPKIMLIRITITLEDPTGRLPEGQTFQYVFPVAPGSTSN